MESVPDGIIVARPSTKEKMIESVHFPVPPLFSSHRTYLLGSLSHQITSPLETMVTSLKSRSPLADTTDCPDSSVHFSTPTPSTISINMILPLSGAFQRNPPTPWATSSCISQSPIRSAQSRQPSTTNAAGSLC